MANNTLADVMSQLLPQSEQVPPRLSESQRDAFHVAPQLLDKAQRSFLKLRVSAGTLVTPLPTTRSLPHHSSLLVAPNATTTNNTPSNVPASFLYPRAPVSPYNLSPPGA
ncbi:hypothetical protein GBF38_016947 [Nibea albiflora]|uniref:Uncharacterized protein n=1 Tax=Nibea albiflora TaxID=240163 RepID=A0ACB7EER0_NIBAL|nr:hypothetical protein GBF38_016947 [Nibea albiflora]